MNMLNINLILDGVGNILIYCEKEKPNSIIDFIKILNENVSVQLDNERKDFIKNLIENKYEFGNHTATFSTTPHSRYSGNIKFLNNSSKLIAQTNFDVLYS